MTAKMEGEAINSAPYLSSAQDLDDEYRPWNGERSFAGNQKKDQSFAKDPSDSIKTSEASITASKSSMPGLSLEEEVDHALSHSMRKFSLYETQSRYYLVGADLNDTRFRILKIDRTAAPSHLNIVEDETIYDKKQIHELLDAIEDGNRSSGGMKLKTSAWGLLGFIRFTEAYYMLLVTKKQVVATLGGNYIYQIDGTELVPLTKGLSARFQTNRSAEENRFLTILSNLDLNHSFYFSYSYNVSRTLQHNLTRRREDFLEGKLPGKPTDFNEMFVWNQYLLDPALDVLRNPFDWCLPIMHGFIDQSSVNVFGRNLYVTIIARRSRFFAGARFLKRGANDLGFVANDVETEQIVADMLVTSFNAPGIKGLKLPNYTSFVQHRGSIPLYWTQDSSGVAPKPAIDLNLFDPFYQTAALHFDNLFERYRAPIFVLNLVKARERLPRESKLLIEYQNAIRYLNQSLPESKRILYRAYDMSRAAKAGQDVISTLEDIAKEAMETTGFFRNVTETSPEGVVQNGVVRSNCIDCLDRTNAAQFVIGKRAFACQLQAMGITTDTTLNYDSDAMNLFAHMFNDHGDTLASQYGGSHLVNTTDSYRKINNWQSHSRDMLESFKRYYHNSFLDNQRQEAYNLFLGNYIYAQGQPMLWELPSDYYLHHANPRSRNRRRDYINWFTPDNLIPRTLPNMPPIDVQMGLALSKAWWDEYYRPRILSSFLRIFAYRINSTTRYLPKTKSLVFDESPFSVRKPHGTEIVAPDISKALASERQTQPRSPGVSATTHLEKEKEGTIDREKRDILTPLSATSPESKSSKRISSLQKWLSQPLDSQDEAHKYSATPSSEHFDTPASVQHVVKASPQQTKKELDRTLKHQWTLSQFHAHSLAPSVSTNDRAEYSRYITHPGRIPLVVYEPQNDNNGSGKNKNDDASASLALEFLDYIHSGRTTLDPDAGNEPDEELSAYLSMASKEDVLTVTDRDGEGKRYQAYRKWMKGKSLFKQSSSVDHGVGIDHNIDVKVGIA